MAIGPERNYMTKAQAGVADIDVGLRKYMLKVYDYMAGGLALTTVIAYAIATVPALRELFIGTPLMWIAMFGTLGIVFFLGFRIHKMSAAAAQTTFWVYAGLNGIWLSAIVAHYTSGSMAKTFLVTACTFAAMSLYGYTTKRDLSGIGTFLIMGLFGIIIAGVVNFFLGSPAIDFAISVLGVLIFTGLTAYDTQKIKEWYHEADGGDVLVRKAVIGALELYLDFINLFLFLLRFLGVARSN